MWPAGSLALTGKNLLKTKTKISTKRNSYSAFTPICCKKALTESPKNAENMDKKIDKQLKLIPN